MYYLPKPENSKKKFKVIFCFLNPVSPGVRVFCLFSYISFILVVLLTLHICLLGYLSVSNSKEWQMVWNYCAVVCIHLASVGFPEPFWDFLGNLSPVSSVASYSVCGFLQLVPLKTSPIHLTYLLTSLICWWSLLSFFNMTNLHLPGILKPYLNKILERQKARVCPGCTNLNCKKIKNFLFS